MKVIGLVGWSGAGKTTLIAKLIPELKSRGLTVSTIKHAHHEFEIDRPGKDSFVHREAGAQEVLVASMNRWALIHELRGTPEPSLCDLLAHLAHADLVLVEGFKHGAHAKIEVHRAANGKPFLFPEDPGIVALASDDPPPFGPVPRVNLDNIEAIASLMLAMALPIEDTCKRLFAANAPPPTPRAQ
jgi:molybdopterin guanine dinucleotide biosynthesis accessory protein MobB